MLGLLDALVWCIVRPYHVVQSITGCSTELCHYMFTLTVLIHPWCLRIVVTAQSTVAVDEFHLVLFLISSIMLHCPLCGQLFCMSSSISHIMCCHYQLIRWNKNTVIMRLQLRAFVCRRRWNILNANTFMCSVSQCRPTDQRIAWRHSESCNLTDAATGRMLPGAGRWRMANSCQEDRPGWVMYAGNSRASAQHAQCSPDYFRLGVGCQTRHRAECVCIAGWTLTGRGLLAYESNSSAHSSPPILL